MPFVKVNASFGEVRVAEGIYSETSAGVWDQISPANGYSLEYDSTNWFLLLGATTITQDDASGDGTSPATATWTGYTVEDYAAPGEITDTPASPSAPGQLPSIGGGSSVVTSPGSITPQAPGSPTAPGAVSPVAPGPVLNPDGYVWTTAQTLTSGQKAQLAENWPEAALFPRYDKIVVDGDSRSAGGSVGDWPERLAAIKPFDSSTITIVAESQAQAHERLAAFDADVLPLAPTGTEKGLYVLYVGVNDLFQIGGANYTVTRDIYDAIKELWAKARTAGFDVCAVTLQDADHTGTGIPFREERQELLNRMILAGADHYDFVFPLHELAPDYTVWGVDALHFGAAGNQFIAKEFAKLIGASDRTANAARQGQGLADIEFNALPALINSGRFVWPPYNLAMATEDTANSGTVTNLLGSKRLTGAASAGSVAGLRMRWQIVNSANRINWPTDTRYRGIIASFARGVMSGDHVFRVSIGNNTESFDVAGFGFEIRNNAGDIEMRAIAKDSSLVDNNSAWEVIGANANLMVVAFAKGTDVTVLWSASNGSNPYEVWQTITTTGAPTGAGGGGNVCAVVEATDPAPSGTSVVDIRSIQAFESETLPLSATKFLYH